MELKNNELLDFSFLAARTSLHRQITITITIIAAMTPSSSWSLMSLSSSLTSRTIFVKKRKIQFLPSRGGKSKKRRKWTKTPTAAKKFLVAAARGKSKWDSESGIGVLRRRRALRINKIARCCGPERKRRLCPPRRLHS